MCWVSPKPVNDGYETYMFWSKGNDIGSGSGSGSGNESHVPMDQDAQMICFPRSVAAISSSVCFHIVKYRLAVDTGESEGKNVGGDW
jgi:hypothetical protein